MALTNLLPKAWRRKHDRLPQVITEGRVSEGAAEMPAVNKSTQRCVSFSSQGMVGARSSLTHVSQLESQDMIY